MHLPDELHLPEQHCALWLQVKFRPLHEHLPVFTSQVYEQHSLFCLQGVFVPPQAAASAVLRPLKASAPPRVLAKIALIVCRRDVLLANALVNSSKLLDAMFFPFFS